MGCVAFLMSAWCIKIYGLICLSSTGWCEIYPKQSSGGKNHLLNDRLTVPLSVTYIHTHLERYLVLTFEYC